MSNPVNMFDLDHHSMMAFFADLGEDTYRASQLLKWIYRNGVLDFSKMTNFSKTLRQMLGQFACMKLPEIVSTQTSTDGTCKWLLRIDSNNCIETVFIPEQERGTLCVSSQVGCALDCSFCATAKQGFNRNLAVSEIIGQVWLANMALGYFENNSRIISNIVLMGMGEPLLNFDNVIKAMNLMMDDFAFGLARKRVTLSTSGIVPGIEKLAATSNVSLAISLHAANNALRDELVPVNKKYPLELLIKASKDYSLARSGDPVTFEYVMLSGVNDSVEDAVQLSRLLKGIPAKVNLIPFNEFPGTEYQRPKPEVIDRFREILMNAGIITITRRTRGEDIDAACGQLVGQVLARGKKYLGRNMNNTP